MLQSSAGPVLHTERLILRPPKLEDLDRWAEMMADPRSATHVGGVQAKPAVWRILMAQAGAWALTGVAMFSVIERDGGRWLGRVGPWQPLDWPGTEVGWGLHMDAWGRGFAQEAARATIDYAFDTLGWERVIHCIHPANVSSRKVAERLGARNLGASKLPVPFDNEPIDVWGQTREEWRARS